MDYNDTTFEAKGTIVTDVTLSHAFPLAHSLRNDRRTRDELYFGDRADREMFFDGEEGFDFVPQDTPLPTIAETARMMCKQQQQERGVTPKELEERFIQQQQQQLQM